jgi:fibronectin-binding autotransporter adhesin
VNTAQNGGAVYSLVTTTGSGSASASFTPSNTNFVDANVASDFGGGLYSTVTNSGSGTASFTLTPTSFSSFPGLGSVFGNKAGFEGGGIFTLATTTGSGSAAVTLNNLSVEANTSGSEGGGIWAQAETEGSGPASLRVTNSLVSNNTSGTAANPFPDASGGGIFVIVDVLDFIRNTGASGSATATFSGDTIDGNTARGGISAGGGLGAAVVNPGVFSEGSGTASISISNTTANGNTAGGAGGGIGVALSNEGSGSSTVTLNNVTASGNTAQFGGGGLALFVTAGLDALNTIIAGQATASVVNSTFADNSGGGVLMQITAQGASRASVTMTGDQVTGNQAVAGGGVSASITAHDAGAASLTVRGSTISGNSAANNGGGLAILASTSPAFAFPPPPSTAATATFTMTTSTVEGNSAGGNGGGLWFDLGDTFNAQGTTLASVTASTIDSNSAVSQGGGVFAQEVGTATSTATLTLTNSTLFANGAFAGAGLDNFASGPDSSAGISLLSDTVAFNVAASFGGGLVANGDHFTVRSTIVADNFANLFADVNGPFASGGHNLIGQTDGSSGWIGTDLTGTSASPLDPLFGDFGNHGGPTSTLVLLSGSPAVGHGDPAGPATDQRGVARSTTAPSIGAYEFTG